MAHTYRHKALGKSHRTGSKEEKKKLRKIAKGPNEDNKPSSTDRKIRERVFRRRTSMETNKSINNPDNTPHPNKPKK